MSQSPPVVPPEFSHYRDIRYLTTGGQKQVFSATCDKHGSIVLKLFQAGTDKARFEREVSAVQQLGSPNIPAILEWGMLGEDGPQGPYVIEPFVPGGSIQQHIDAGSLQDHNIIQLAHDVLSVLTLTEQKGIVHRDIKPANLLLHADTNAIWVLDFGIARHLDRTALTIGPMGPCTPGFAPPEQFNAVVSDIDVRSDLFALGVTLYTCVERKNPYLDGATSHTEVFQRMQSTQLPRLSREPDGLVGFTDLVAAMTQLRRTNRPRTAAAALEWLDDLLAQRAQ